MRSDLLQGQLHCQKSSGAICLDLKLVRTSLSKHEVLKVKSVKGSPTLEPGRLKGRAGLLKARVLYLAS